MNHQLKEPLTDLVNFMKIHTGKIIFSVESEGRREAMLDLLARIQVRPMVCDQFKAALSAK